MSGIDSEMLGRAIHKARTIGGPWPSCVEEYGGTDECGDCDCECESMARHLLALMTGTVPFDPGFVGDPDERGEG